MYLSLLSSLITYVCVLLAVAFFTLLERKGLRYIQIRKGPNKVGIAGLPQPLADAAKLLTKEIAKPLMANYSPYFLAPIFSFIFSPKGIPQYSGTLIKILSIYFDCFYG